MDCKSNRVTQKVSRFLLPLSTRAIMSVIIKLYSKTGMFIAQNDVKKKNKTELKPRMQ